MRESGVICLINELDYWLITFTLYYAKIVPKGFKNLHNVLSLVIYFLLCENRAKGIKNENYFNKFPLKKYRVGWRLYFSLLQLLRKVWLPIN